jgi:hypothetical protein
MGKTTNCVCPSRERSKDTNLKKAARREQKALVCNKEAYRHDSNANWRGVCFENGRVGIMFASTRIEHYPSRQQFVQARKNAAWNCLSVLCSLQIKCFWFLKKGISSKMELFLLKYPNLIRTPFASGKVAIFLLLMRKAPSL